MSFDFRSYTGWAIKIISTVWLRMCSVISCRFWEVAMMLFSLTIRSNFKPILIMVCAWKKEHRPRISLFQYIPAQVGSGSKSTNKNTSRLKKNDPTILVL